MRRFRLINLFLSSLCAILVVSCSPVGGYKMVKKTLVTEKLVKPIVNKTSSLLYKAQIDFYNKHYSGMIILKQTDSTVSHLTFVTEIGMKMFDFEIRNNDFKLVYVFEPLNKPKAIKLLESDMKLILLHQLLNKEAALYEKNDKKIYKIREKYNYYYKVNARLSVNNTLVKGALFAKVKVNYKYNDSLDADQISLKHKGFMRLRIELNKLNKLPQP